MFVEWMLLSSFPTSKRLSTTKSGISGVTINTGVRGWTSAPGAGKDTPVSNLNEYMRRHQELLWEEKVWAAEKKSMEDAARAFHEVVREIPGGEEMVSEVLFSSATGEYSTPWDLFDSLNREFFFELDPCATVENAKCMHFYTKEDDGLSKPWHIYRSVFVNPPYGKRVVDKWVKKAFDEALMGCTVVCLLPARTDTRWFHEYIWNEKEHRPRNGVELRFLKGRIKFNGMPTCAPFPSIVVVFHGRKRVSKAR